MHIDLNCDLGEGSGHDDELMPLITSANVACGFHAGDAGTALAAVRSAAKHGVQVGAHPGFADRPNFGRVELDVMPDQVYAECVYQIGALVALARAAGLKVRHLKAHGALYNMACRNERYARPIADAAALFELDLLGLPQSQLQALCPVGRTFIAEGFADRRYEADGSLVPRSRPDAFVHDPTEAVQQAERLIEQTGVRTLCVHGDNAQAVAFVKALHEALIRRGHEIRKF